VGKPRIANSSYAAMTQQMSGQNKYDDAVKINHQPSGGFINPSAIAASSLAMNNQFDNILKNLTAPAPTGPYGASSNPTSIKSKVVTVTKLLVSNLPIDYDESQIKEILRVIGNIKHLEIITDPNTGKYKGEVYVQYEKEEDSRRAETTLLGMNIKDAYLSVKKVQSTTTLQDGGYGGGLLTRNEECAPSI